MCGTRRASGAVWLFPLHCAIARDFLFRTVLTSGFFPRFLGFEAAAGSAGRKLRGCLPEAEKFRFCSPDEFFAARAIALAIRIRNPLISAKIGQGFRKFRNRRYRKGSSLRILGGHSPAARPREESPDTTERDSVRKGGARAARRAYGQCSRKQTAARAARVKRRGKSPPPREQSSRALKTQSGARQHRMRNCSFKRIGYVAPLAGASFSGGR